MVDLRIPGYDEAEEIGRGGFATVYKARRQRFGDSVAIKLIDSIPDERAVRRVDRELAAVGKVAGHRSLVAVYDAGWHEDGRPYIVMELVPGGTLARRLAHEGPLPWPEVAEIGVVLANALQWAHDRGVIHRDLKPENVLVDDRFTETRDRIRLGDFGVAAIEGRTVTSDAWSIAHVAPEVILDGVAPTVQADLYGLASTLYQLLDGDPPFAHEDDVTFGQVFARMQAGAIRNLRDKGVADVVASVIEMGLQRRPTDRPATASEFAQRLAAAAEAATKAEAAAKAEAEAKADAAAKAEARAAAEAAAAEAAARAEAQAAAEEAAKAEARAAAEAVEAAEAAARADAEAAAKAEEEAAAEARAAGAAEAAARADAQTAEAAETDVVAPAELEAVAGTLPRVVGRQRTRTPVERGGSAKGDEAHDDRAVSSGIGHGADPSTPGASRKRPGSSLGVLGVTGLAVSLLVLIVGGAFVVNGQRDDGGNPPESSTTTSSVGAATTTLTDILLEDNFSNPRTAWPVRTQSSDTTKAEYGDSAYRVTVQRDSSFLRLAAPTRDKPTPVGPYPGGAVTLEVTATLQPPASPFTSAILYCGGGSQSFFYTASIRGDGYFSITRYDGASGKVLRQPSTRAEYSPEIKSDGPNRIRFDCLGSSARGPVKLALYVNGQKLAEIDDNEGIAAGPVGVAASYVSPGGPDVASVAFDDFIARRGT